MGTVRLELMTSCMSSMRSNQLSYAPARLITISFSGTFVNKKTHAFKIFRAVCAGGVKTGRQKRTGGAGRALFSPQVRVKRRSGIDTRGEGYGGHAERGLLLRERAQPLKTMPQNF